MTQPVNPWNQSRNNPTPAAPNEPPDPPSAWGQVTEPPSVDARPEVESVWAAYRDGLNDLARADATARDANELADRTRAEAIARAEEDLAAATAKREALEAELPLFEARIHRALEAMGVSPDGAGAGSINAQVHDVDGARTAMAEITRDMNRATTDLSAARGAQGVRQRHRLATGIVALAVLVALVSLSLMNANSFAVAAGAVLVFAVAMLGRRRGPVPAGIAAGVVLAGVVLAAWLTGPVVATIILILAAVIGVIVLIRPRRRTTRSTPGGSRV